MKLGKITLKVIDMYTASGYTPEEILAELACLLGSGMLVINQRALSVSVGEHVNKMTVEVTVSTPEGKLHIVK
jgi:hypothetical protein